MCLRIILCPSEVDWQITLLTPTSRNHHTRNRMLRSRLDYTVASFVIVAAIAPTYTIVTHWERKENSTNRLPLPPVLQQLQLTIVQHGTESFT